MSLPALTRPYNGTVLGTSIGNTYYCSHPVMLSSFYHGNLNILNTATALPSCMNDAKVENIASFRTVYHSSPRPGQVSTSFFEWKDVFSDLFAFSTNAFCLSNGSIWNKSILLKMPGWQICLLLAAQFNLTFMKAKTLEISIATQLF